MNGTVFGQPNGSVYTPPANHLTEKANAPAVTNVRNIPQGTVVSCYANKNTAYLAHVKVTSQVPFDVICELATDSAFATVVSSSNIGTTHEFLFGNVLGTNYTVVNGTTYYARARIVTKTGQVTFLTTSTYTVTGVV